MFDEGPSGYPDIDIIDLDISSPSAELKEIIQQQKAENRLLQQKLETANWTINYLEQHNKQLEDEHTLDELRRIREDRNLARKRPGDLKPIEQGSMLIRVNTHLDKFLAKANRDKFMLCHMKNHYWARMHVCKAKLKILKGRLSKALKRRKRADPLQILAKASLTEHGTLLGTPSPNFKKFGENFVISEFFMPFTGFPH